MFSLNILNYCVGPVPHELCTIPTLAVLDVESTMTCFPSCLTTVPILSMGNVGCEPTFVDISLCAFIAATNVASIRVGDILHDPWACDSAGYTESDPCAWPSVTCASDSINAITINGGDLNGTIPSLLGELSTMTSLELQSTCLSGK